jgi:hypothetical protein
VALTRIWARSRTLWDWDEAQFAMALGDFDVVRHHPHPPGFPLYIVMAKLVRLFAHSDFHALQAIVTLASIALFPLLFWLAWELRFSFHTAYFGSLLFVFLPNVWFYGGTAFSDIPGLALVLAACAMLLRGCRDRRAYFFGALLLGLAAAIRPQALLVGCAPALVASWYRMRERRALDVACASAIGIFVLLVSYGGAALASDSVEGYLSTAKSLREYVRKVDSFLNPDRPPAVSLFGDFFIHAIPGGRITEAIAALALVAVIGSIVRRDARVWLLLAMFLPFNVIGWFMLDINSISRYSIGYAAMYTLLAADALTVWRRIPSRALAVIEAAAILAITVRLVWWTLPALREVRRTSSPPVAAMQWIRANVPRSGRLYVHGSMRPWVAYMLGGYHVVFVEDPAEMPREPIGATEWFVNEDLAASGGAHNFVRERGRLFDIARRRYFEVFVAPAASGLLRFGPGWYLEENTGTSAWRWMSGRSETLLPPIQGNARLSLGFDLPTELVPRKPAIEVRLNGQLVDRFVCTTPSVKKTWIVPARANAWNPLVLTMDKVINPQKEGIAPDSRDLGLNLTSYSWSPAGAP